MVKSTSLREAGEILAGKTGYDEVVYKGERFSRAVVVSIAGRRRPDGSRDISSSAARQYVRETLRRMEGIALLNSLAREEKMVEELAQICGASAEEFRAVVNRYAEE